MLQDMSRDERGMTLRNVVGVRSEADRISVVQFKAVHEILKYDPHNRKAKDIEKRLLTTLEPVPIEEVTALIEATYKRIHEEIFDTCVVEDVSLGSHRV
jgi:hypothetical protein